jgi:hypothetical protein
MTTKPKTRKAPAKAAPEEPRTHRAVTVQQRDALNEIRHLVQVVRIAIRGTDLEEHEREPLCALARTVDTRLTALIQEFDAFSEADAA